MKIKGYKLNSFAKAAGGGNPAGVVLNADALSEKEMKKIAAVLGFSETAFVSKSNCADFKVRFFTPNEEVDLCGHATIGTFFTMFSEGVIQPGKYTQETKAGVLKVEVKEEGAILMEQNLPAYYDVIDKASIADSLNISEEDMIEELPVQVVSTGLKDIMVPIKDIKRLHGIIPDFKKIEEISKKYDVTGYHVFTLETLHHSTAHCRNFAPLYGIPEESATGTSNGALSCYLHKYGKIEPGKAENIIMEQGYSMNKPSEIAAALSLKEGEICEVKVGGKAMELCEIEVEF